jgi:hypothetical protein
VKHTSEIQQALYGLIGKMCLELKILRAAREDGYRRVISLAKVEKQLSF